MKHKVTTVLIFGLVAFVLAGFVTPNIALAQEEDSGVTEAAEVTEGLLKESSAEAANWFKRTYNWLDDWRLEKAEKIEDLIETKRAEYEAAKDRRDARIQENLDGDKGEAAPEEETNEDTEEITEADVDNFLSQPFLLGAYVITLEIIYFVLITKTLFFILVGLIALHLIRSLILVIVA